MKVRYQEARSEMITWTAQRFTRKSLAGSQAVAISPAERARSELARGAHMEFLVNGTSEKFKRGD